ncbi:MAG: ORF6N domain-containing protein [Nitrospira sp.]
MFSAAIIANQAPACLLFSHAREGGHPLLFRLTIQEFDQLKEHAGNAGLRSQNVTSKARGGRRYLPYVFTEQGVAMLSSVLNSKRAIQTNIVIMRAFVQLRQLAVTHKRLGAKLAELERTVASHDEHINELFEAIRQLMEPPASSSRRIGFREKEENEKRSIMGLGARTNALLVTLRVDPPVYYEASAHRKS